MSRKRILGRSLQFQYLVPVGSSKRDPASVLYILAHQRVPAGVLQSFLDLGRLVADDVDYQLGAAQLPELLVRGFDLTKTRR